MNRILRGVSIHPTVILPRDFDDSTIGDNTTIWAFAHISTGAVIGSNCMIGEGVHVGPGVKIGDGCRIQNGAQLFEGVTLEDDVFIGPHVVFTNVLTPRAFAKRASAFDETIVKHGASIGANATIVCGVTIYAYAVVGAGSVVTKGVGAYRVVRGVPAIPRAYVCRCGVVFRPTVEIPTVHCAACNAEYVSDDRWDTVRPRE